MCHIPVCIYIIGINYRCVLPFAHTDSAYSTCKCYSYPIVVIINPIVFRGGSRKFQNGGGGGPGAVEFLVLRFAMISAPSHIHYVFVRKVVNNIHILNTAC